MITTTGAPGECAFCVSEIIFLLNIRVILCILSRDNIVFGSFIYAESGNNNLLQYVYNALVLVTETEVRVTAENGGAAYDDHKGIFRRTEGKL